MENKDFIIEEEVFVTDENLFGVDCHREHIYRMTCYDGYAIGELIDEEDEQAPKTIRMEYPTLDDVIYDKGGIADYILTYRGLYNLSVEDIHYGDIMMCLGEVVN